MLTEPNRLHSYSDLGEAWLRDQTARILQRHLQFGRHLRLDVDSLLARSAMLGRVRVPRRVPREDILRRAIEHCLRLDAAVSTAVPEPTVA
jgi:hypothetical protein